MRRVGVATFARSDYSSCLPVLRAIEADPDLEYHLLVAGMHLAPEFGSTVKEIEAGGFAIADRLEMLLASDRPEGVAKSIGLGTILFAQSFARCRPDILLIFGDRLELLAVASAALPLCIPIAHVSGGEVTEGAIDNQVRHAITKMSHLHFVAMDAYAERLIQMGEDPWRVFVTGDPALDAICEMDCLSRPELAADLGIDLIPPVLVITLHPTTLGATSPAHEVSALLGALQYVRGTFIFTYPNADPGYRVIIERTREFTERRPQAILHLNLGQRVYYSLLAQADLMVGNSSSGIWEAPSFRIPVVDIGDRQKGRIRAHNVVNIQADSEAIYSAIQRTLEPGFRSSLSVLQNPYGDGHAAGRITQVLRQIPLDRKLLAKSFYHRSEMSHSTT